VSGSLRSLRELNRLRVLGIVRERGQTSRADIARQTGLARSTVSNLVGELQRDGLIVERDTTVSGQGGRPAVLLTLNPAAGAVIGVHFDHGGVRVALGDLDHTIRAEAHRELDVDHEAEEGLEAAAALVDEVIAAAGADRDRVLGVGAAIAGPVSGILICSQTRRNAGNDSAPFFVGAFSKIPRKAVETRLATKAATSAAATTATPTPGPIAIT